MAIQPINYAQQAGLGGFETGFNQAQGVADAFNKQQMLGQQQELMDRQAEESRNLQSQFEAAYKSGDIDALNVLGIQNPEVSNRLLSAIEKQSGAKKDEVTALAEQITYNPDGAEKILTDRIQVIQSRNGDPSNTVQMLKEYRDPKTRQNFLDETRATFAMTASPERFKKYRDFSGGSSAPQYTNIEYDKEGNPFGLNKATGQFEKIEGGFVRGEKKPQTVVNVGKAEGEQAKTIAKAEGENYNQIIKDASSARSSDQMLNRLANLTDKAFSGSTANIQKTVAKMLSTVGYDVEGLTESELFESIGNNLVLNQTSKLTGVLTDKDMEVLASTVPQLTQSKEGRKQLIEYAKQINEASKEKARLASKYRKENNGQFDYQGFEEWLIDQPKEDRIKEFKPTQPVDIETPSGLGTTPVSELSDDELMKSLGL